MREAIIIFTRVPIPGRTKTRLQGFLTKDQCAEIHKNFLKDIKKTCEKLNKDIFVFYTPEDKDNILEIINSWVPEGYKIIPSHPTYAINKKGEVYNKRKRIISKHSI